MTNSRAPAAIGDLVYTHDAGTFTFTLGAKHQGRQHVLGPSVTSLPVPEPR